MLNEKDIERLCHGRIIKAPVYNSSGTNAAGPHRAVMLDTDEAIREHDSYFVAVISHDDRIDKFIMPVPAHTGLTGFIQCSWVLVVELPGIAEVGARLLPAEMAKVLERVRAAGTARTAKATKKRSPE